MFVWVKPSTIKHRNHKGSQITLRAVFYFHSHKMYLTDATSWMLVSAVGRTCACFGQPLSAWFDTISIWTVVSCLPLHMPVIPWDCNDYLVRLNLLKCIGSCTAGLQARLHHRINVVYSLLSCSKLLNWEERS